MILTNDVANAQTEPQHYHTVIPDINAEFYPKITAAFDNPTGTLPDANIYLFECKYKFHMMTWPLFSRGKSIKLLYRTTDLLQDSVDLIPILELEHLGGLVVIDALTIEEEAEGLLGDALALGVGLEDLAHLGGLLDLELGLLTVLVEKKMF